jgi:sialate O-acetylesterase
MKKSILKTIFAIFQLIFIFSANAQIKLPGIVSSNMVLQRNTTVNLWGWAAPNEKITIKTSWKNEAIHVIASKDGTWKVEVETTDARIPQTISLVSNTSNIILENILFGEVWLCSGQSNMGHAIKGNAGEPVIGSSLAIITSNNPNLRLFTIERIGSKTPLKDLQKNNSWKKSSPETVANFSAVAYFFGQQLQEVLDVPVGLINTSWGGSSIEAWMSNDVLSKFQTVNLEEVDITIKTNLIPTVLFNAMIHPIVLYKIKGALWYQGESNRTNPENYKNLFPAMVKDWRNLWGNVDFPFYYVQIAPFTYGNNQATSVTENSAFFREAQLACLDLIPNSGIAITLDVGDENSIHPPKKKEVADRLLFNALNQTYGIKAVKYASPNFKSLEIKDNGIILSFKNPEIGLYAFDALEGFEIAGEDKVFHPANAKIINKRSVLVNNDKVSKPVAVRYAWRNYVSGTLFDTNLLPLSSFRTDNWTDANQTEK